MNTRDLLHCARGFIRHLNRTLINPIVLSCEANFIIFRILVLHLRAKLFRVDNVSIVVLLGLFGEDNLDRFLVAIWSESASNYWNWIIETKSTAACYEFILSNIQTIGAAHKCIDKGA